MSPSSVRPEWFTSTGVPAVLTIASDGRCGKGESVVAGLLVTGWPPGRVAVAFAVLCRLPLSRSAWVNGYGVAWQAVDVPGASVVASQVTTPASGSLTASPLSVTLPVFSATNP